MAAHGRAMWIRHGCRCGVCHADLLVYSATRRAVRAVVEGREPTSRIPAGPVRRHVDRLRARGMTVQQIADAAGVCYSTVDRLANRRLANVALPTARAVLAL